MQVSHAIITMQTFLSLFFLIAMGGGMPAVAEPTAPLSEELINIIHQRHYLHPEPATLRTLTYAELNEYLKTLDPYSQYFTPVEYEALRRQQRQQVHIGLGVNVIGEHPHKIAIPYQQGPAKEAGLTMPRYIRSLDGQPFAPSLRTAQTVTPDFEVGKVVQLGVSIQPESAEIETYPVRVRAFKVPSVELVMENATQQIIRIYQFRTNETAAELQALLDPQANKTVIIDLRYCIGGSLYEAIDSLSLFLPAGTPVLTLRTRKGEQEHFKSVARAVLLEKPVYLLVGPYTVSSAEVFSMVLKHHQRGILVGHPTRGKCLSQQTIKLAKGAAISLSVYEITTPADASCQAQGVMPDIWLPTADLIATERLLQAGVRLLTERRQFVCFATPYETTQQAEQQLLMLEATLALKPRDELAVIASDSGQYACVGSHLGSENALKVQQQLQELLATAFIIVRFIEH